MLTGDSTLALEHPRGLYFLPYRDIASIAPDYPGRWRVVARDGTLAYTPNPPLPQAINPQHLRDGRDPAGFAWPPDSPILAPLPPAPNQHILYLEGKDGQAHWHTDSGPQPAGPSAQTAASQHPDLVRAGRGRYVNRNRLRWLLNERKRFRLILDNGQELTVSHGASEPTRRDLGLDSLYHLFPEKLQPLLEQNLRDWPVELYRADKNWLIQEFEGQPRRLIANLIWQTYRWRQNGHHLPYGVDHRGFWYRPVVTTLARTGFQALSVSDLIPWAPETVDQILRASGHYALYLDILGELVGQHQLFTFQQLGFRDPRPDLRSIGAERPQVLIIAEKSDLQEGVQLICQHYGTSSIVLGGLPSLLSSEFMARDLHQLQLGAIQTLAYVDFDPGGWIAAQSFCDQLRRYGLQVEPPQFLVHPGLFSPEEIELFSMPIATPTPQIEGKVQAWLALSGGIQGQPRRLLASSLQPPTRVLQEVARRLA